MKYCLRGMLEGKQSEALVLFTNAIAAVFAPSQDECKLCQLQQQVSSDGGSFSIVIAGKLRSGSLTAMKTVDLL